MWVVSYCRIVYCLSPIYICLSINMERQRKNNLHVSYIIEYALTIPFGHLLNHADIYSNPFLFQEKPFIRLAHIVCLAFLFQLPNFLVLFLYPSIFSSVPRFHATLFFLIFSHIFLLNVNLCQPFH